MYLGVHLNNKLDWTDNTDFALQEGKELKKGIKLAKSRYKRRIEENFENNNPHSMWRGIKTITDYKRSDQLVSQDSTLPDTLNTFYARFDTPVQQRECSPSPAGRTASASSPAAAPSELFHEKNQHQES
ncbi:hypothetical protein L3Q82_009699 [Scortum barcoo]|uniref:Uncharacterized protein n=1 Tax=Scortum barcoo TaxID=214431 RepID=A0ACB8WDL4_9TELE|nr:hypothetical protein L3Q82_009699 [Scortum barcoo]